MSRRVRLSLIIPFRAPPLSLRAAHFRWLLRYYASELPDAEIVIGRSWTQVFSKTQAINQAVRRSHGRVIAVVDADAYLPGHVIQACANRLDQAATFDQRRWFIPYRRLYRLTASVTEAIVASDPTDPLRLPTPPPDEWVESTVGSMHGRRYGALMVIYPREAFDLVGGMDPRFAGWGGEDVAFARALDTLWGHHKTTDNDILHLWHPKLGDDYLTRAWAGQTTAQPNAALAARYGAATGDPVRMAALVAEGAGEAVDPTWLERLRTWVADAFSL
jgi:hypothetical protein